MTRNKTIVLNIVLPFLIGGIIYLLFRPTDLLLFNWVEFLGLKELIEIFREFAFPLNSNFPDWIIYSLPNGLWLYSLIISILTIWRYKINQNSIVWIFLAFLVGIGAEFGQLLGIIQGTFDINDLLIIIFFGIVALAQSINFSIFKFKTLSK